MKGKRKYFSNNLVVTNSICKHVISHFQRPYQLTILKSCHPAGYLKGHIGGFGQLSFQDVNGVQPCWIELNQVQENAQLLLQGRVFCCLHLRQKLQELFSHFEPSKGLILTHKVPPALLSADPAISSDPRTEKQPRQVKVSNILCTKNP